MVGARRHINVVLINVNTFASHVCNVVFIGVSCNVVFIGVITVMLYL